MRAVTFSSSGRSTGWKNSIVRERAVEVWNVATTGPSAARRASIDRLGAVGVGVWGFAFIALIAVGAAPEQVAAHLLAVPCRGEAWVVGLLREAGFTPTQGKGDHEKWRNGTTWTIITQTTECSPKVVKDALDAIERSKQQ